jgi:CRISPR/Cas system CSM-associated protein Csm3 (group 7 of RAMP superfamily)
MTYRAYFKLRLELRSPLAIGASTSEHTDKDIVLDSRNVPIIPATALAGVLRARTQQADELFGFIQKKTQRASQLLFYDAQLQDATCVATRDSVALDKYKTAMPGKKFDFQVVEPGAVFIGYAEARTEAAKRALLALLPPELALGAKGTRGYGRVGLSYQMREFRQEMLHQWLEFDMFDWAEEKWSEPAPEVRNTTMLTLELAQRGSLSIRQYMTEENQPDFGPMALHDDAKTPVIPGTSWAGMFRHHMETLLGYDLRDTFGYVDEEQKQTQKSKITYSESVLRGAKPKNLTRTAIDRFTNGTKNGALYTERTVYGGTTTLTITLENDVDSEVRAALCATILDLHKGYAALGGLTAVGRGLFTVTQINDVAVPNSDWDFDWLQKEVLGSD